MELAIGKLKVAQWLVIHPPQPLSSTPALVAQRSELASLRSGGSRVFTQDISTSGHLRLKELFRHSLYIHSVRSRGHPTSEKVALYYLPIISPYFYYFVII